jgi:hypothetical protein
LISTTSHPTVASFPKLQKSWFDKPRGSKNLTVGLSFSANVSRSALLELKEVVALVLVLLVGGALLMVVLEGANALAAERMDAIANKVVFIMFEARAMRWEYNNGMILIV